MIRHVRQLTLDALGVLLMLASPFLGIIPGPGGMFVFLAGLWLLAKNHGWAERWLNRIKKKGMNLIDLFFIDNPIVQAVYDLIAAALIILGINILDDGGGSTSIAIASFLNLIGLSIFLGNRQRIQRLAKTLNQFFKKSPKK